jgi:hypothetical protein
MRLRELFEAPAQKIVAVMPGGFHPFHPGHKSLYDWAVKTFGKSNVYVAATNDTSTRPFPFEVKKQLASMAGVPGSNFIQVKSPFNAQSYANLLDANTALVFVRSEKDKSEQPKPDQIKKDGSPGYLRTYTNLKDLEGSDVAGYMAYGPTIDFKFAGMDIKSATQLRNKWPELDDETKLKAAMALYGNDAPKAVPLLNKALSDSEAPVGEANKPKPIKPRDPSAQTMQDLRRSGAMGAHKDKKKLSKQGYSKHKGKEISELDLFKSKDSFASVKEQDPNKLKVLDYIATRNDGKEHFLSFYRKGAAWSGRLMFIKPDQAKTFMQKVEDNEDYLPQIKQALTSLATTSKLFDRLGIKYDVRRAE